MPIQSTSEGKISLAKGIIFTKIGLANGYIFKLWAAPPYPKFSREPPREKYEHFKVNMQHVGDMDGAMTFSENKGSTHVLGVLSRVRDLLNSGNRKC